MVNLLFLFMVLGGIGTDGWTDDAPLYKRISCEEYIVLEPIDNQYEEAPGRDKSFVIEL